MCIYDERTSEECIESRHRTASARRIRRPNFLNSTRATVRLRDVFFKKIDIGELQSKDMRQTSLRLHLDFNIARVADSHLLFHTQNSVTTHRDNSATMPLRHDHLVFVFGTPVISTLSIARLITEMFLHQVSFTKRTYNDNRLPGFLYTS